jgi:hypothetical protein
MPQLSDHILTALDDAVAQEVGARLRQVALNVPPGSGAPALPAHFEESLQRLKTLHAQAKILVGKIFGDAAVGAISSKEFNLTAFQNSPALETLDARADLAGHSNKSVMKKKRKR